MEHNLFGFSIKYANGSTDWGLILATDRETARLELESCTFAGIEVTITIDQPTVVDILHSQYGGIAFLTTEPSCN